MYVFINEDFVDYKEASLHISDLAIHRGYGIFDFLKVGGGHPFFINDYLDRFYHSANYMRLYVPLQRDELIAVVLKVIEKNRIVDGGLKIILTGGYSPDGYQPMNPNLIIIPQELVLPPQNLLETGVTIITHEHVRDIPEVKTINYTMGIWLLDKVRAAQAYDVLYQKNGVVSEFPRSNFFIVDHNNNVITPKHNVLKGVTRKNVLIAAAEAYQINERDVTVEEVFAAKEAFISSTTKRVIAVVAVDGKVIGNGKPGDVTKDIWRRLVRLEEIDFKNSSTTKG